MLVSTQLLFLFNIIFTNSNKYILAYLHSKYALNFILKNADTTGAGDVMLNIQSIETLRIPEISENEQEPFIKLVDIILAKKENGENTDAEEKQIDMMVYNLYGLTEEEIEIIEGR